MNLHDFMIGFASALSLYAVVLASQNRWLLNRILQREAYNSRANIEILSKLIELDNQDDGLCKPLYEMTQEEKNKFFIDIAHSIQTPKTCRIVK